MHSPSVRVEQMRMNIIDRVVYTHTHTRAERERALCSTQNRTYTICGNRLTRLEK